MGAAIQKETRIDGGNELINKIKREPPSFHYFLHKLKNNSSLNGAGKLLSGHASISLSQIQFGLHPWIFPYHLAVPFFRLWPTFYCFCISILFGRVERHEVLAFVFLLDVVLVQFKVCTYIPIGYPIDSVVSLVWVWRRTPDDVKTRWPIWVWLNASRWMVCFGATRIKRGNLYKIYLRVHAWGPSGEVVSSVKRVAQWRDLTRGAPVWHPTCC